VSVIAAISLTPTLVAAPKAIGAWPRRTKQWTCPGARLAAHGPDGEGGGESIFALSGYISPFFATVDYLSIALFIIFSFDYLVLRFRSLSYFDSVVFVIVFRVCFFRVFLS